MTRHTQGWEGRRSTIPRSPRNEARLRPGFDVVEAKVCVAPAKAQTGERAIKPWMKVSVGLTAGLAIGLLVGCARMANTIEQEAMWARLQECGYQRSMGRVIIRPDGSVQADDPSPALQRVLACAKHQ